MLAFSILSIALQGQKERGHVYKPGKGPSLGIHFIGIFDLRLPASELWESVCFLDFLVCTA